MALTLVATAGAENANSYATVAVAVKYFEARRNTQAWDDADDAARAVALCAATQRLEQERYVGYVASFDQRLRWPRAAVVDDEGRPLPAAAIPRQVVEACCELALVLLTAGDTDPFAATGLEAFAGLGLGSLDLTPNAAAPAPGALPAHVLRCLRGLLSTSTGQTRLVRA